jgi:peptide/nickel transport system permease protein
MFAYTVRRLFAGVLVLFAASAMVYFLVAVSGDPLEPLKLRNPPASPLTLELLTQRLSLDTPIWQRYLDWIWAVVTRGDFGPSVVERYDIGAQLIRSTTVTLRLVFVSVILALIFGVVAGVISAVKQYSWFDYGVTFTGFLFLAMPSFWIAVLLKHAAVQYNLSTGTTTFYTLGDSSPDTSGFTAWEKITDLAGHMFLPTIALALISYAAWSRYQRASMLEVLNSDYVRLARAKGLRWRKVMTRHALRTALIPLTTVTALDIAGILGGAVITETVFNWNGLGRMLIVTINRQDTNAVAAWLLLTGFIVVFFNIIADLLYAVLDPRIRYE